jgi:hypothetical protein
MTLYPPLYMQEQAYPAQLDRMFLMDMTSGLGQLFTTGSYVVSQRAAGANLSVDVAAGRAIVPGTDTANQGSYYCWSDAVTNVPINTPPGTGQSRIDTIVLQVQDDFVTGGGLSQFQIVPIQGTPATTGSQVQPTLPASCLALANVLVGPSVGSIVTANITDRRPGSRQNLPRGLITSAQGPPTQTDYSTFVAVSGCTITFTPVANRRYLMWMWAQGSAVASATQLLASFRGGADRMDVVNTIGVTIGAGGVSQGSGYMEPTTTPGTPYTFGATASANGGPFRVAANGMHIHVLDVGGT